MSLIHAEYPKITTKELSTEIWHEINNQNNPYYQLSQIKKILAKYDLLPNQEADKSKSACFDE